MLKRSRLFNAVPCPFVPLSLWLLAFGYWLLAVGYWHYIVQMLFNASRSKLFNASRLMLARSKLKRSNIVQCWRVQCWRVQIVQCFAFKASRLNCLM